MSEIREAVLHVARLAELDVPPADADRLARDIAGILEYISKLNDLPLEDDGTDFVAGPTAATLREDRVEPTRMTRSPAEMAPEFIDGFYVVPRLEAMEDR